MKLQIKEISKEYKTGQDSIVKALDNVSIDIDEGDYLAICGVSGSGKSTLLNVIGGLTKPDSGQVLFDDTDITKFNDRKLAEFRNENIGFVFQDYALIPYRTVYENLEIPLLFSNYKHQDFKRVIDAILKTMSIEEFKKRRVSSLSGGQKQRVAIARALVCNPSFVLADEPTGALDSDNKQMVIDLLKVVNEMGKTVIVVTHDNDVANSAKKILNMKDGRFYEKK